MWNMFVVIALTAGGFSLSVASTVEAIPLPSPATPQETVAASGEISGNVVLAGDRQRLHGVRVLIIDIGRSVVTDEQGSFRLTDVPPGTYRILAQREHLVAETQEVVVIRGETVELSFELRFSPVHEEITITATGRETTAFEAFNSVSTLDSIDLAENMAGNLGDVLEREPGIAKRSFGAGNGRPIIRGFDGDRVLIMQDGIRSGDVSSQSGDHGVSIDPGSLQRVEVLKGPATLLYGSNAVGGVVNTITPHDSYRYDPPQDLHGQVTLDGGTANEQLGGNANFQYASGDWMIWFGGGARRAADYDTPLGTVENSDSSLRNARGGLGYFGDKGFASVGYTREEARYGVPFASEFHAHHEEEDHDDHGEEEEEDHDDHDEEELAIDLDQQRQAIRIDAGLRGFSRGPLESVRASMNFVDYWHQELEVHDEEEEVGTRFDNDTVIGRLELNQRPMGRLSGQIGLWGQLRDFVAVGEEALAPPAEQTSLAAFAYEEVDLGRVKLQLGARIERNDYSVAEREEGHEHEEHHEEEEGEDHHDEEELEVPEATPRDFTGVSGSMGLHVDLTDTTALVGNFTRSYRAPALEELYNFGPHVGNLAFEVGNPDLNAEKTRGMDLSVRHQGQSFYGQANFFYYDIEGFVFPDFTDEFLDGLRVAKFVQGDSRFVGLDASGSLRLRGNVRLNAGLGLVDAKLTESNTPLPRIPPLHARLGLDLPVQRLTLRPELVWAARQDKIFSNETVTDGYAVVNFTASYTAIARAGEAVHVFTLKGYNLGNTVYRNHTSFIKDLAPEMGRGVLLTWALRLF